MTKKIAVIIGSLRKESHSRKVAKRMIELMPEGVTSEIIEIDNLPLYNEDIDVEGSTPSEYTEFRNKLKDIDGVLFVTPEYNRSVPAALKNAIDVGSRPYGQNMWDGIPAAVVSISIGAISGFGANHHLRQSLVFLNMPTLQQPEAYLNVSNILNEDGSLGNGSDDFLKLIDTKFIDLVNKF